MSGQLFESEGGIPNLGLHDQALALQWIQEYIHLFGGDKRQVTVSGMSFMYSSFSGVRMKGLTDCYTTATQGFGSILYHLVSHGGSGDLPFQRAWVKSPGVIPTTPETQDAGAVDFLAALGVSSFSEARKMDPAQILQANADVIYEARTSSFKYGPQAGGSYVNTTVLTALNNGLVHGGVDLLVSHTANEGVFFMPTFATTDGIFTQYLIDRFPNATESQIWYIVNDLYPLSAYDGQCISATPLSSEIGESSATQMRLRTPTGQWCTSMSGTFSLPCTGVTFRLPCSMKPTRLDSTRLSR